MSERKRNRNRRKKTNTEFKAPREKLTLDKASSQDLGVSRMTLGAKGYDGLKSNYGKINESANAELSWPASICTYNRMSLDPTIAAVQNFYNMMISRAEFDFSVPEYTEDNPFNPEGKSYTQEDVIESAKYLNYCMSNLQGQTWQQFISGIGTYRIFGFSVAEKVWTTVKSGKYKGRKKWKSLSQRSQETIEAWSWDKTDPDLLSGVIQKASCFDVDRYGTSYSQGKASREDRTIPRGKFLLFRFDPKNNNPQGTSPLNGCWEAWKYLQLVREYQAVGVAKDLGGIPVIGYPVEKLIEAAADPSGAAATTLDSLKASAAALHAGDESFAVVPIDYDDTGKSLYSFELKGITGGGKQYDTSEVIRQYQNEILTCYSASMLKLGQDSTGSFALSDNMSNLLAFGVQHNLDIISNQINVDLVPQTLAVNGWLFEEEDMPKLTYGDIAPRDLDEVGKFIQRAVTSGAMTISKGLDQELRRIADLPSAMYSDTDKIPEGYSTAVESNAGKGDGTSGTGASQNAAGGDNNSENS